MKANSAVDHSTSSSASRERSTIAIATAARNSRAVSREATPAELTVLAEVATQYRTAFAADSKAADEFLSVGDYEAPAILDKIDLAAWTGVARVILNLSETITRP